MLLVTAVAVVGACSREIPVPVTEGQDLPAAHAKLMAGGWRAVETGQNPIDGESWREGSMAADLLRDGYRGVESCAGTGMSPCVFNYISDSGACLRVVTRGEYDREAGSIPVVTSWSLECPKAGYAGRQ